MSKEVDSGALVSMNRLLGLAGSGANSQSTELEDGLLTQVIDVNPIVRRSRTPAQSTGWFLCSMTNVHSAGDTESSTIDPYNPGVAVNPTGAYPDPVPRGVDVWICGMSVLRTAGAGELTGAQIDLGTGGSDRFAGWGVDDGGALLIRTNGLILTQFAVLNTTGGGNDVAAEVGTGLLRSRITTRVRRGIDIRFFSNSGAAATFALILQIGLFPEGLGQDIVT